MLVSAAVLNRAARLICAAAGSNPGECDAVANLLVEANLRGHDSHGIGMLPQYIQAVQRGALRVNQHAQIVLKTGSILVIDGQWGYGQVIGAEAMNHAIELTRTTGMALVALRNSHHLGRIGGWAEQCLGAGFVSLHFVNVTGVPPRVAPFAGADARFGTNPVCIGIPAGDGAPIVLDMATSRIAMGKARVAKNKGESAPEGCIIDSTGRPTRDPGVMFQEPAGSLLPFGEHKGSGLGLICELLGGALTGGLTIAPGREKPEMIINNMLSIVIDPAALGTQAFRAEVLKVVEWAKASPVAPGAESVLVAGEPERRYRARRLVEGISVDEETWREILETADSVGVSRDVLTG